MLLLLVVLLVVVLVELVAVVVLVAVTRMLIRMLTSARRRQVNHTLYINVAQYLDSRCVLLSDPGAFGGGRPNQNTSRIQRKEV